MGESPERLARTRCEGPCRASLPAVKRTAGNGRWVCRVFQRQLLSERVQFGHRLHGCLVARCHRVGFAFRKADRVTHVRPPKRCSCRAICRFFLRRWCKRCGTKVWDGRTGMGEEREGCQPHVVTLSGAGGELKCASRCKDENGSVEQVLSTCTSWERRVVDDIENGLYDD